MIKSKTFFLMVVCAMYAFLVSAQDQSHAELKKAYPDKPVVVLNKEEKIVVTYKKNKLGISIEVTEDMMYMDKTARAYHGESVYHGTFTSIEKIKAYSLIPKKGKQGKFRKKKVVKYSNANVTSAGIFYDDQQELSFDYTGLVEGAKTHLEYKENVSDPKFIGRNFFSYTLPALRSVVSISIPNNVKIGYNLINVDTSLVKYSVLKNKKSTTHTWIGKNLKSSKKFANGVDVSYYAPHVIIYFKTIQHKESLETVLPDTKALYSWYHSIVKDVNIEKSEVLKSITDSLLVGVEDTQEKAKKIYYWVQDNIKYVAFEDGMGGFVPRNASLVCQRRFGDCKDMSSILVEMLGYAGIEGHLTWIGTRDLPYRYSEIHTPAVDNHMIASYNFKGKTVFLDAVGTYTPYGFTTEMIQGKEALIGVNDKEFQIQKVPVVAKQDNAKTDVVQLSIYKEKLIGKGEIIARGYSKLDMVYGLINLNDTKRKEKLITLLHKGNNKFLVDEASFDGIADRDKDLNLKYKFTLGNYINRYKNELYINLHLTKELRGSDVDTAKREGVPVKFDYTMMNNYTVSFAIPKGYLLHHIPSDESFEGDHFGFHFMYSKSGGKVTLETVYYNDLLIMDESHFEQWNEMVAKLSLAYKENLVFKKQ
jgi:hypothetical protein